MPVVEISVSTPNGTGTVLRVDNERVRTLEYQSDTITIWLDDGIGGMTINNISPDGAAQIAQRLCGVEVKPDSLRFRSQRVMIYAVEYPEPPAVSSDDVALSA